MAFADTFKPQDINQEVDRFGRPVDVVQSSVDSLGVTPSEIPEPTPEPTPEPDTDEGMPEWAKAQLREQQQEVSNVTDEGMPEWAKAQLREQQQEVNSVVDEGMPEWAKAQLQEQQKGALIGLPEGVVAYSYSQDDIAERDELYNLVYDAVLDRYGKQAVYKKSRADIVDEYMNNRRGNAAGNSVRVISEVDYLMDIKDDPERLLTAGKGYAIFEGMEGLTGEGVTWTEMGEGVKDYARTVIFDPINAVTIGFGRFFGGTALRTAVGVVEKTAQKAVAKELLKGASREGAKKIVSKIYTKTAAEVALKGAAEITEFATKMAATKGGSRIMTNAGLKEIAAATVTDAVINSGAEFLYQRSLVETNVQGEISKGAVGLAALASMAMGGLQAGLVAKRGMSGTALVSEVMEQAKPKDIVNELQKSITDWVEQVQKSKVGEGPDWLTKVRNGKDITDGDTDFFIDILLGRTGSVVDPEDVAKGVKPEVPALKGLAQLMQEGGYFFVKKTDDDKISNWVSDFMRQEFDQSDIDGILKAVGQGLSVKIDGKLTPELFADAFANKMNSSARSMNSVMQVAKKLDANIEDLDIEDFFKEALGLNVLKDTSAKTKKHNTRMGILWANVSETQNKFIRTLVSHPSTSALNVVGYGAAAGLDASKDLTMALYRGTRGTFKYVLNAADGGKSELEVAKQLLISTAERVKFALDPDMTYAAYKSAMVRNTGALDTLNRTLSGGVQISNSLDQMSKLGGRGGVIQDKVDTLITGVQQATFVHAQDSFTKSQEYVSQMNKQLRLNFKGPTGKGMGWNEFYNHPSAAKVMGSKKYKEIELAAVTSVLENTFSKSYKGADKVGQVAGIIEDARNIPGLGFMIPFGRFFNNTIDFGLKNTPLLNIAAKATGKYADTPVEELMAKGAVTVGLLTIFTQGEDENRRLGLGLYDTVVDGQVVSQQYDYPISLFKAAGRILSYKMAGEEVPGSITKQVLKDFGGGGLTRNLNKTTTEFADFTNAIIAGELKEAGRELKGISGDLTAQAISGFLRPLEPIDAAIGLFTNTDQRPKDVAQGNLFVGNSLRYVDTVTDWFLGNDLPAKVNGATGERDQQTTKNLGIRTLNLTDTQRVMNLLGINQWDINSGLSKDRKRMIPEAVNEYQRQVAEAMEPWAKMKMENDYFRNTDNASQMVLWTKQVAQVKKDARFMLMVRYSGPQSTLSTQYELLSKYSGETVEEAIKDMGLDKTIGELTDTEIYLLESELSILDFVEEMSVDSRARN